MCLTLVGVRRQMLVELANKQANLITMKIFSPTAREYIESFLRSKISTVIS